LAYATLDARVQDSANSITIDQKSQNTTSSEPLRRHHLDVLRFGSFDIWRPRRYPGELPSVNVISRKV